MRWGEVCSPLIGPARRLGDGYSEMG